METIKKEQITRAVSDLGIGMGDTVLVHSSFKSLGTVDGGAETVIQGFLDAIGPEGTLVFPTFCQKNFRDIYKTWHIDKESDVGYLTNYFRCREGSVRSNQATHSVAACGKNARELTRTHGHTAKRYGNMGDTPFAADSPWEKMYQTDAMVVMLGVSVIYTTFRHYAEYCYIEQCLNALQGHPEEDTMKAQLAGFLKKGVWPHLDNEYLVNLLEEKGKVHRSQCGNAELTAYRAGDFVNLAMERLNMYDEKALKRHETAWDTDGWIAWTEKFRKITENS